MNMGVTPKPKPSKPAAAVDIEALINKGGSVSEPAGAGKAETTAVVLRVPAALLQKVDAAVKARPLKIPRHTWMLEALLEKLSREDNA